MITMANKLPYNKVIGNRIRKDIGNGVGMRVIFSAIQHLQYAPKSMRTFYTTYDQDISEARAKLHGELGAFAMARIKEGSDAVLIHALKSKAGWNPSLVVEEKDEDDGDENSDAVDRLAALLGRKEAKENLEDSE
jgi:hypothetical protein